MWSWWCTNIEEAYVKFLNLDAEHAKKHKGRGQPHLVRKCQNPPEVVSEADTERSCLLHLCDRAKVLRKRIPRLQQWIQRLRRVLGPTKVALAIEMCALNVEASRIIRSHLDTQHVGDSELAIIIDSDQPSEFKICINLVRICKLWQREYDSLVSSSKKRAREAVAAKLKTQPYLTESYKRVRGSPAPPLLFLKRDKRRDQQGRRWVPLPLILMRSMTS